VLLVELMDVEAVMKEDVFHVMKRQMPISIKPVEFIAIKICPFSI